MMTQLDLQKWNCRSDLAIEAVQQIIGEVDDPTQ